MTDIVERLRDHTFYDNGKKINPMAFIEFVEVELLDEAADEIELLRLAVKLFANRMRWDRDDMSVELTGYPGSGAELPKQITNAINRALSYQNLDNSQAEQPNHLPSWAEPVNQIDKAMKIAQDGESENVSSVGKKS